MTEKDTQEKKNTKRPCKMKRIAIWTLAILLAIFIILPLTLSYTLPPAIKLAVEKFGSEALGCPVTVEDIDLSLFSGTVDIMDFKVGSPEGFKATTMSVHEVYVDLRMTSLLSDTIIIDEILIDAPEITYEMGIGKSNIGAIMKKLEGDKQENEEEVPEEEPVEEDSEESGKKVCIRKVAVTNGKIKLSATFANGHALPIPLPDITLENIGGNPDEDAEAKGASIAEAIDDIFTSIFTSVTELGKEGSTAVKGFFSTLGKHADEVVGKTADSASENLSKAAEATGEALGNAAEATGEAAGKAVDAIKGFFK